MNSALERNKTIARRFFLELHGREYQAIADEVLDPNIIFTGPGVPEGANPGREGFKAMMLRFETAFPDRALTIDDMVAEGEYVVGRWTFSGTHKGPLPEIAPTGKYLAWTGVSFLRIAWGRVVRDWVLSDRLSMLQQLGVLPASKESNAGAVLRPASTITPISARQNFSKQASTTSPEQNKALARQFIVRLHSKDYAAAADEILDWNYVVRGPASPRDARPGPEGFKELMNRYQAAFHDQKVTVDEQVAEGEKVAMRWTFQAVHKGSVEGIRPTGKQVTWAGVSIQRIVSSKIVESWTIADSLTRLQQLGAISSPAQR